MLVNTHSFKMSKAYIGYLEYGLEDGLDEYEIGIMDKYLECFGISGATYEYEGLDDSDYGPCVVCGLMSDRVTVQVWQNVEEEDKE